MKKNLYIKLVKITKKYTKNNDPSHDIEHALRVLNNVEVIAKKEGGDLDTGGVIS